MEEISLKRNDPKYIVFSCINCGQYMYVKKKQKSKKCLRCGRSNEVNSVEDFGEMVNEMTNAVEKLKQKQNEFALKVKIQYLLFLFENTYLK